MTNHHDDLTAVSAWMRELAAQQPEDGSTVDPQQIWWKAELLRRWDAQRRAAAPIQVGERVEIGVGLAGAVTLLAWLIRRLPGESLYSMSSTLTLVILASILLVGSAAAFAVWSMVTDE